MCRGFELVGTSSILWVVCTNAGPSWHSAVTTHHTLPLWGGVKLSSHLALGGSPDIRANNLLSSLGVDAPAESSGSTALHLLEVTVSITGWNKGTNQVLASLCLGKLGLAWSLLLGGIAVQSSFATLVSTNNLVTRLCVNAPTVASGTTALDWGVVTSGVVAAWHNSSNETLGKNCGSLLLTCRLWLATLWGSTDRASNNFNTGLGVNAPAVSS
mmetsp:Transcript_54021/g.74899  ORF Transcript_54021/g.74899 Transcript_54021/m.74899 type:complete len:214 (-) Transcript_54021:289-930(-)